MKAFDYFCLAFTSYATFKGRSRRYEYFSFMLGNAFILFTLELLDRGLNLHFLTPVWQVAILLPSIAVAVRRIHDSNKPGWFILIPLYNFYLVFQPGDQGDNSFGPSPKEPDSELSL